jgi:hypothetical protein
LVHLYLCTFSRVHLLSEHSDKNKKLLSTMCFLRRWRSYTAVIVNLPIHIYNKTYNRNMYYSFASVYSYCLKWLGDRQRLFGRVNAHTAVRIYIYMYKPTRGMPVGRWWTIKKKLKLDSTSVGRVCVYII